MWILSLPSRKQLLYEEKEHSDKETSSFTMAMGNPRGSRPKDVLNKYVLRKGNISAVSNTLKINPISNSI